MLPLLPACLLLLCIQPACPPWQGVPNNYETDLIFPIVAKAAELAGMDYTAAPPPAQTALKVRVCLHDREQQTIHPNDSVA
jgi:hypothetical protein